jgi:glycosyltransferase involved in cell wall biosynthesis
VVPRENPRRGGARHRGPSLSGEPPLFSVVVPTRGDDRKLASLFDSLEQQTYPSSRRELLVVFDGAPASAEISGRIARVGGRAVVLAERHGPGAARNRGAREAVGEWLAFTEDDCVPDARWLERAAVIAVRGEADVFEGETVTPSGTPVRRRLGELPLYLPTNLFVRRERFLDAGGYCEYFYDRARGIYFREDSDLGFTLEAGGARVAFDPSVRVTHPVEHPDLLDPIRWARRYEMDALLEWRHPRRFRERIEVARFGPLRVRRVVLRAGFGYVIAFAACAASLAAGESGLAALFVAIAVLCLLPIWAKWRFDLRRLPITLIVPIVLVAAYLRGIQYARKLGSPARTGL